MLVLLLKTYINKKKQCNITFLQCTERAPHGEQLTLKGLVRLLSREAPGRANRGHLHRTLRECRS